MSNQDIREVASEPLREKMCATCPFREGSKTAYLKETLTEASVRETRICHSTGSNNAFHKRTGISPHICRGSRDFQLQLFFKLGVIESPTDEAWNKQRVKCGMEPTIVKDP